jgi:hypothetical protein
MHPYITQNLMTARVQDMHARAAARQRARQVRDAIRRAGRGRVTTSSPASGLGPSAEQITEDAPSVSDSCEPAGTGAA